MCVIAIKPSNVKISRDTVEDMFTANPHGAGVAIVFSKKTFISKGYMSVDDLWKGIKDCQDYSMVLHFRFATHGQINQEMTHPFIIDTEIPIATQIYTETDQPVLTHNGVLSAYGNNEISDTCDFIISTLAHLPSVSEQLKLLKTTTSKYTLIKEGKIYRVGEFKKYKGLRVSNTDFAFYYGGRYESELFNGKISDCGIEWQEQYSLLSGNTYCPKKR